MISLNMRLKIIDWNWASHSSKDLQKIKYKTFQSKPTHSATFRAVQVTVSHKYKLEVPQNSKQTRDGSSIHTTHSFMCVFNSNKQLFEKKKKKKKKTSNEQLEF